MHNIEVPNAYHAEHKIRVFGQTKTGQVGHLSEQRHVWLVMLLCNYQSSTTRNELMSAQTALKTDQSVHCLDTRPTMLLFLFCALIMYSSVLAYL